MRRFIRAPYGYFFIKSDDGEVQANGSSHWDLSAHRHAVLARCWLGSWVTRTPFISFRQCCRYSLRQIAFEVREQEFGSLKMGDGPF